MQFLFYSEVLLMRPPLGNNKKYPLKSDSVMWFTLYIRPTYENLSPGTFLQHSYTKW